MMQRSPDAKSASNPNLSMQPLQPKISTRKRKLDLDTSVVDALASFKNEILDSLNSLKFEQNEKINQLSEDINCGIKGELNNLTQHFRELKDSLEHTNQDLLDVNKRVSDLEKIYMKSPNLEAQLAYMQSEINDLRAEQRNQQQRARLLNLELRGLPEVKNENLSQYVTGLAQRADVILQPGDIIHITRVQKMDSSTGHPRNIIVQLKNKHVKDALLSGARKARISTTMDLGLAGDTRKIFIGEHLTPENKLLYKRCREKAREMGYQFTWTRDCRIFVRRNEQSPSFPVNSEKDLKKIAN